MCLNTDRDGLYKSLRERNEPLRESPLVEPNKANKKERGRLKDWETVDGGGGRRRRISK